MVKIRRTMTVTATMDEEDGHRGVSNDTANDDEGKGMRRAGTGERLAGEGLDGVKWPTARGLLRTNTILKQDGARAGEGLGECR